MLHYFLIYSLLAHATWALPAVIPQQQPIGEIASHIVIVTPQAEVHLEPTLKYDSAAFIQHLAPVARFASPHEETIVYYPASAAAAAAAAGSILPIQAATTVSRTDAGAGADADIGSSSTGSGTKQYETIIEQIQTAIQTGSSTLGPQLTEAAAAAASAAASAGSSFFPGLFPANKGAVALTSIPEKAPEIPQKLIELKPELTPAATQPLISDGRHLYALAAAPAPVPLPQVIDLVHAPIAGPILLSPVSAIRARSIANPELPVVVLPNPEALKPDTLPLQKKKTELKENKCDAKKIEAEKEKEKEKEKSKNNEFGRSLEGAASNVKEQQDEQQQEQQQAASEKQSEQNLKKDFIKSKEEQPAATTAEAKPQSVPLVGEEAKFQSKSAIDVGGVDGVGGGAGGGVAADPPQAAPIVDDAALPHEKVVA